MRRKMPTTSYKNSAIIAAFATSVILLFVLIGFLFYRRKRRQSSENLFGSTIKIQPIESSTLSVGVQPKYSNSKLCQTFSTSDLDSFDLPTNNSGLHTLSTEKPGDKVEDKSLWKLSFKIYNDYANSRLELTVFQAKCYPERYSSGYDSSLVIGVFLLPDEIRHQTALYPNTGSPSFDEMFTFPLNADQFAKKHLRLSLYEMDVNRIRHCLGHTLIRLAELTTIEKGGVTYLNKDMEQLFTVFNDPVPEMHVSLLYNAQTDKLKVQIFAARNLPDTNADRAYKLRTVVLMGTKTAKIKETPSSFSVYGVFQSSYVFQVPQKHVDNCALQFDLLETNENGHETSIGSLLLGPCTFAHGSGVEHWKQMLQNPRKPVEMWHKLRAASRK